MKNPPAWPSLTCRCSDQVWSRPAPTDLPPWSRWIWHFLRSWPTRTQQTRNIRRIHHWTETVTSSCFLLVPHIMYISTLFICSDILRSVLLEMYLILIFWCGFVDSYMQEKDSLLVTVEVFKATYLWINVFNVYTKNEHVVNKNGRIIKFNGINSKQILSTKLPLIHIFSTII